MIITYEFCDDDFEYDVDFFERDEALRKICSDISHESLINILLAFDTCKVNLSEFFKEELKEFFTEKAYKAWRDCR